MKVIKNTQQKDIFLFLSMMPITSNPAGGLLSNESPV